MKIKMVLFDLDGVFTDGNIYISENTIFKFYNSKDTYGLKLLKDSNIKTGLITAHKTPVVNNMKHIITRMDHVYQGKYNKLEVLNELLIKENLSLDNIAYIGDDIPDIPVLKKVGFSACPNDAIHNVKKIVNYICKNNGGNGAVREFCELIINKNKRKKVVAFVPIKFNSIRLPNKNILDLNGKPLCRYIFDTLLKVKDIDEIYVYCSDVRIKKYIPEGIKYLERSNLLDSNNTLCIEFIKSFVNDIKSDIYILCHATCPYIEVESINNGLKCVLYKNYDSAFSVKELKTYCWYNNTPLNYNLNNVPKTQDIKPIFCETSGFYIFNKEVIQNNRRIGNNPKLISINFKESIDIDYYEDYNLAQKI